MTISLSSNHSGLSVHVKQHADTPLLCEAVWTGHISTREFVISAFSIGKYFKVEKLKVHIHSKISMYHWALPCSAVNVDYCGCSNMKKYWTLLHIWKNIKSSHITAMTWLILKKKTNFEFMLHTRRQLAKFTPPLGRKRYSLLRACEVNYFCSLLACSPPRTEMNY